ncbi:MAG: peptidoglycan DD-metalloendopeptidase family protein [Patescibacteria group bacterium]
MSKQIKQSYFIIILFLFLIFPIFVLSENNEQINKSPITQEQNKSEEILTIEQQIKDRADKIKELEKQNEVYKRNIEIKKMQQITLNGELDILGTKIDVVNNALERTGLKIKQVNLEIQDAELKILRQGAKIEDQKEKVAEFIRIINYLDQKSPLEILIVNDSISDYFNQVKFVKTLEYQMQGILDKLQITKQISEQEKKNLEDQELKLENLKKEHKETRMDLEEQETIKEVFLKETKNSESKFQALLLAVKKEQEQANAEIVSLEKELREKLKKELAKEKETIFIWPVPKNIITAKFHDPTYLFKKYFEHNAVDIRAKQGSSIVAAASGYIGRAKNAGMGYSYILIIHNNGFSTVYGHVSKIYVKDGDRVDQGQIIGITGGMPGTPGAGKFSTGPHLHFEIYLNGNVVDPEKYLP